VKIIKEKKAATKRWLKTKEWTFCEESILSVFHMPHQTSGLSSTVEWRGKKEEAVTPLSPPFGAGFKVMSLAGVVTAQ
jgi:hypothetical protein